eukprot:5585313-Amphidinium_carterae.1
MPVGGLAPARSTQQPLADARANLAGSNKLVCIATKPIRNSSQAGSACEAPFFQMVHTPSAAPALTAAKVLVLRSATHSPLLPRCI